MKRYFAEIMFNMRDIGGYPVKDGGYIIYKKIIRSDVPNKIGENEIKKLINMNIKTIIDFRTIEEIEEKPTIFSKNNLFEYYNCNIKGGEKIPDTKELVTKTYMDMLEEKEVFKKIFQIIAQSKNGILYYCTAGKDRTGVVTAVLLSLLGVPEEIIIKDYQLSDTEFIKRYKQTCSKEVAEIITPKAEYMQNFFNELKIKYNNAKNYLYSIGITEQEIHEIREKLINRI